MIYTLLSILVFICSFTQSICEAICFLMVLGSPPPFRPPCHSLDQFALYFHPTSDTQINHTTHHQQQITVLFPNYICKQSIHQPNAKMADQLVERIPVYLSQEFSQSLHLVKSPLRDPTRPYNDVGPLKAATFKPNSKVISFQYSLDQNDAHYNRNAENQIDSFTLQTTVTPKRANYVIGQRTEDAFILHPITAIHSLLPGFSHVDAMQQEYDNDLLPQQEDEETAMKQVQLKVKRAEKVGGVKRVTHDTLTQSIRDERAQNCTVLDVASDSILNGDAPIPQLTPAAQVKIQSQYEALAAAKAQQSTRKSSATTPTTTTTTTTTTTPKSQRMGDSETNMDDIDSFTSSRYREETFTAIQQSRQEDFQRRQDQLLTSPPLYRHGKGALPLTSQPPQLATTTSSNTSTTRPGGQSLALAAATEPPTPLGYIVAPFISPSPTSSDANNTPHSSADARNTISISSSTTPLTDSQILQFMLFSRVTTFKSICQNLNVHAIPQYKRLIEFLSTICFIVNGNFVLKSQYVYNHDPNAKPQPINKQQQHIKTYTLRLSLARTYILYAFSQVPIPPELIANGKNDKKSSPSTNNNTPITWKPSISQRELSDVLRMDPKELIPILKEIAAKKPLPPAPLYDKTIPVVDDTIWEFMLPIDTHFLQTFPTVAANSVEQLKNITLQHFPQ